MSSTLPLLGVLLALDSLVVGAALGPVVSSRFGRWRLALAFGLCDGLASLLGWAADWRATPGVGEWLGPAAVGGYGLYVLGLAWRSRRLSEAGAGGWLVLTLPLCLSLDNLALGVGPDASAGAAALAALAFGAVSGVLALVGLRLGGAITACAPARAEWVGGAALLAVGLALLCKEVLA
jgi:putative Mn2+ efflux pump MntP